jgi:hypothetical protein
MTEIETILTTVVLAAEPVTVTLALELTGPLKAVVLAVMVVVPAPTPVTSPEEFTVATAGFVAVQFTPLVIFAVEGCFALPYVPVAVNCAV